MFETLYSQIGAAVVVIVVGFAFLKGGEPERAGAAAYGLGFLASLLFLDRGGGADFSPALMAIDVAMLAVLAGIAWRCRRAWPVWACAFQTLTVMSHLLRLFEVRSSYNAFLTVINLAQYGVLIALAVGTFWSWQERRAAGIE